MNRAIPRDMEIFTLSDLIRLILRIRTHLWKAAVVGVCLGLLIASKRSAGQYEINATFVDAGGGNALGAKDQALHNLLSAVGEGGGNPPIVILMKSHRVLKPLIEEMGLQAEMTVRSSSRVARFWTLCTALWRAEKGLLLEEAESGFFKEVHYVQNEPLSLYIRYITPVEYEVFSSSKQKIAAGRIGEVLTLPQASWILVKAPVDSQCVDYFPVQIRPWESVSRALQNQVKIAASKKSASVYELSLRYPYRERGQKLLNGLMEAYRNYLHTDHAELAQAQLAYLEKRKGQLYTDLEGVFAEHETYLKESLHESGCVNLEQEVSQLVTPYQEMSARLMAIGVELARLDQPGEVQPIEGNSQLSQQMGAICRYKEELCTQRDLLGLSLLPHTESSGEAFLQERFAQLRALRHTRESLVDFLAQLEQTARLPPQDAWPIDMPLRIAQWASYLPTSSLQGEEGRDFLQFFREHVHLLSLQEKNLAERWFQGREVSAELAGIDLAGAQLLFAKYNELLDHTEADIRYFRQLLDRLPHADFEVSSLGTVLQDPVSQSLIQKATCIACDLKDEKNHSAKEEMRLQTELLLQKKLLTEHLTQLVQLKELTQTVTREKLEGVRTLSLECIHRHLALLDNQLSDLWMKNKGALQQEEQLLQEKMKELRAQTGHLPEKWKLEKLLTLKTELGVKAMHAIVPLVEAKTVNHHLHSVASRPLDEAQLPTAPIPPHLVLFSVAGAATGCIMAFFICLLRALFRGFPASREKLLAMHYPWIGAISSHCDGPSVEPIHCESIRAIAVKCDQPCVTLISGKGPNYSHALAELFGRTGKKVLLIQCDFSSPFRDEEGVGLMQWLEGSLPSLPVRHQGLYDWVSRGGVTPFGMEALLSQRFQDCVEAMAQEYDQILLFVRAPLGSSEAYAVLRWSQQVFVTVRQEPMELLTPFAAWAYHEGQYRLSFVTCDE